MTEGRHLPPFAGVGMPSVSGATHVVLALLSVLASGCGPIVVWHGRSPDRVRRAVIVEEGARQRIVVDGQASEPFDAVGFTHLAWTSRGPVVPVERSGRWHVSAAGELGPAFEAIGELLVRGERLVYAAQDEEGWRVVDGGVAGPAFESLRAGSLALDAEGRRLLYIGRDREGEHAVIDGEPGPAFDRVAALGLGAKGALTGYVGVRSDGADVVIDGRVVASGDEVRELALATSEPRWAAIVVRHDQRLVVHGARSYPAPSAEQLAIAAGGGSVAWLAPAGGTVEVWRDGAHLASHLEVDRLRFVPASGALLYVAREADGAHVVHDGAVGPRLAAVEALVASEAGHVGYAGRRGVGRVVVIDGAVRYRGEWAGGLTLAARSDRYAFIIREAGRRFVVTPDARVELARPFVDTLVLDPEGERWAIAVADPRTRRLDVVVDGRVAAPLDMDEVSAAVLQGRDPVSVVRAIVLGELERSHE